MGADDANVDDITLQDLTIPTPCNGWHALCSRRYDEVVFPGTHASAAQGSPTFTYPAQRKTIRAQLDGSIRVLMLEVRVWQGALSACFRGCSDGHVLFSHALGEIEGFLRDNPREVVTLFIENHAPAADIAAALEEARLGDDLIAHGDGSAWPLLGDMIQQEKRLVVILDDAVEVPPGLLSFESLAWATGADFHTPAEMRCDASRGNSKDGMGLVLHYLTEAAPSDAAGDADDAGADSTPGRPSEELAKLVDSNPFLIDRLEGCRAVHGRLPNFVVVDFYDSSDVVVATQKLNGLIP
jgi:hypothetical protein